MKLKMITEPGVLCGRMCDRSSFRVSASQICHLKTAFISSAMKLFTEPASTSVCLCAACSLYYLLLCCIFQLLYYIDFNKINIPLHCCTCFFKICIGNMSLANLLLPVIIIIIIII